MQQCRSAMLLGLIHQLKLLVRLWIQPAAAMGEILDRGSLLFASLAAVAAALAAAPADPVLHAAARCWPSSTSPAFCCSAT